MLGPGRNIDLVTFVIGIYTWLFFALNHSLDGWRTFAGALCGLVLLAIFASAHAPDYEAERSDEAARSSAGLPWYEYERCLRGL